MGDRNPVGGPSANKRTQGRIVASTESERTRRGMSECASSCRLKNTAGESRITGPGSEHSHSEMEARCNSGEVVR
jgi:hypothetical protein